LQHGFYVGVGGLLAVGLIEMVQVDSDCVTGYAFPEMLEYELECFLKPGLLLDTKMPYIGPILRQAFVIDVDAANPKYIT